MTSTVVVVVVVVVKFSLLHITGCKVGMLHYVNILRKISDGLRFNAVVAEAILMFTSLT